MLLAGDIGGTHTRIGIFDERRVPLRPLVEKIYPSRQYSALEVIVGEFLDQEQAIIDAACFGIAGPVLNGKVTTLNLPWTIEALELQQKLGIQTVWLINDLQAHASGLSDLSPEDFVELKPGASQAGNAAMIAAGTGLGEAGLFWDGTEHHAFACEGGHADFAPNTAVENDLLCYLRKKFGHVSCERVLSGPGIKNIFDFLRDTGKADAPAALQEQLLSSSDVSAKIAELGLAKAFPICEQVLDIFVRIYGAESGNLALRMMATAGTFLSGGIAAHLLPKLKTPAFCDAFLYKGRLQPMMELIPIKVVANDQVGMIGAARHAAMKKRALPG